MIKPDGVQRGLVGTIISRFEAKGFYLRGMKMQTTERAHAEKHYADLSSKPFFGDLVAGPPHAVPRHRVVVLHRKRPTDESRRRRRARPWHRIVKRRCEVPWFDRRDKTALTKRILLVETLRVGLHVQRARGVHGLGGQGGCGNWPQDYRRHQPPVSHTRNHTCNLNS